MTSQAALELVDVTAGYGRTTVLRSVCLTVQAGSVVALLGPNGVGKSTLLRTAVGLLRPTAGKVLIGGEDATSWRTCRRSRNGVCLVPEGRGIFRSLTVQENLRLHGRGNEAPANSIAIATDAFPELGSRLNQVAGTLSGGQQQMLAIARSYVSHPRVVLLDEVSTGLAPKIIDEIFGSLSRLATTGTALLIVEQYVSRALKLAQQVVILNRGRVGYAGSPADLDQDEVLRQYLGFTPRPVGDEQPGRADTRL